MESAITNARIVLPDRVIEDGVLIISDGLILEFGPARSLAAGGLPAIDARGAYLVPGIVDAHNDGVEEEVNPRPRANFPMDFAIANFELRSLAAGVTTAFHAVMFADLLDEGRTIRGAAAAAEAVQGLSGSLIDHELLYRLDVWTPDGMDPLFESMRKGRVQVLALNDHTPGQGQYQDIDEYKKTISAYLAKATARVDAGAVLDLIQQNSEIERSGDPVEVFRRTAEELAKEPFVLLAHDPDTPEKIEDMADLGVTIAEFPVSYNAAERARQAGMWITMGAPNVVRGGSTSGNLSAVRLAGDGLLDILCGDYHAPSLLFSALLLHRQGVCDLPTAVNMITANPAKALSLDDRGRIEQGYLADLCIFDVDRGIPRIARVLKRGETVYTGGVSSESCPPTLANGPGAPRAY